MVYRYRELGIVSTVTGRRQGVYRTVHSRLVPVTSSDFVGSPAVRHSTRAACAFFLGVVTSLGTGDAGGR